MPRVSNVARTGRGAAGDPHRVHAGAAQDRATTMQDAGDLIDLELPGLVVQHPTPPVAEPHEGVAMHSDAFPDHRSDDGVQPGAVAAAGEDPESHASEPTGASLPSRDLTGARGPAR